MFGRQHKNVLRDIEKIECSDEFSRLNFELADYLDEQGKKRPMVEMTRDGFTFLVMGFTGRQAAEFKEAYIGAFNAMAERLAKIEADTAERARMAVIQAEIHWFPRRPHWSYIRDLVLAGTSYTETARRMSMKPARVRRAVRAMTNLGIIDPYALAGAQSGNAFHGAIRRMRTWGRRSDAHQLTLPLGEVHHG